MDSKSVEIADTIRGTLDCDNEIDHFRWSLWTFARYSVRHSFCLSSMVRKCGSDNIRSGGKRLKRLIQGNQIQLTSFYFSRTVSQTRVHTKTYRISVCKKFSLGYDSFQAEVRMDSVWCRETLRVIVTYTAYLLSGRMFSEVVDTVNETHERPYGDNLFELS